MCISTWSSERVYVARLCRPQLAMYRNTIVALPYMHTQTHTQHVASTHGKHTITIATDVQMAVPKVDTLTSTGVHKLR